MEAKRSQYNDEELAEELEFYYYGCERAMQEGKDVGPFNSRRKELEEDAKSRGIMDEVNTEAAMERAKRDAN